VALLLTGCFPFQPPVVPVTPAPTAEASATGQAEVAARVTEAMTSAGIIAHQSALQQIADAHGDNRAVGTPGYTASVAYVRDTLAAAGYRVSVVDFSFTRTVVQAQSAEVVEGAAMTLSPQTMEQSPSMPGPITAELRLPSDPLGCSSSDYAGAEGMVVLVERGRCTFTAKSRAAAAAGVAALLIFDPGSGDAGWHGTLGTPDGNVPTAALSGDEGRALQQALAAGTVRLRVDLRTEERQVTSQNVIADWPDSPAGSKLVMAGAHLDSVAEGPGINDNGSGVGLVLELAETLAAQGNPQQVRFGFWGAEELGLIGSRAWVDGLDDAERARISGYLNFDMVSSPNGQLGVYGDSQIRNLLTTVLRDTLSADPVTVELNGASDHASFADKGIPVGGIFTGAGESGADGHPADPCYHRACDNLDSVDGAETLKRLDVIADGAALALLSLLRDLG